MKREVMTINEQGILSFPADGSVWMTEYEITDLFQVFYSAVIANRKSIFKSGILCKEDVCREIKTLKGCIEEYNLEMIIALAFRIKSYRTMIFRKWLLDELINNNKLHGMIMFRQFSMLN